MDAMLRDDINDLLGRIDRLRFPLQDRLDAAPRDPELSVVCGEVLGSLAFYEGELNKILSPRFDRPELASINETAKYQIGRRLDEIEDYLIPQVMHFNDHDRMLTRLIKQIAKESNWPDKRQPFAIPDSSMYYVSFPYLARNVFIVREPSSGPDDLRSYPFLVHEMTHTLLRDTFARNKLQGNLRDQIGMHFLRERGLDENTEIIGYWRDDWLEELTCDMVATFVMGKTFADQTMRGSRLMWKSVLTQGKTHPAWGARLYGSAAVLRKMGHDAEAREVEAALDAWVQRTGEKRPAEFAMLYPPAVLNQIAAQVVKGCNDLNIKGFDKATPGANEVSTLVATAWGRFRKDSATYRLWESGMVKALRQRLGFSTAPVVEIKPVVEVGPKNEGPSTGIALAA